MASRTVRRLKQSNGNGNKERWRCAPVDPGAPFIVVTPPPPQQQLQQSSNAEGVLCSVTATATVRQQQQDDGSVDDRWPRRDATPPRGVVGSVYKPVPPPRPLGSGRAPPAASPAPPGAHAPALHTHSSKFPVDREVVVSNSDKTSKVPGVQQFRRVAAVAPDAPPRLQAAWTVPSTMQSQQSTAPDGFRQPGPSRACLPQEPNNAVNPPVPLKQTFIYGTRADCKYEESNGASHQDPAKDGKEAKSTSKAMTKTYHTLKDMISSRFKGKDSNESDPKAVDAEAGLNNVTDELRKSMRAEQEANNREAARKTQPDQSIYGRPVPQQRDLQYNRHMVQMHHGSPMTGSGAQQTGNPQILAQQQYLHQQILLNQQQQHMLGHGPNASSTPQHGMVQARSQELLNRQNMVPDSQPRPHSQMMQQMNTTDNIYYQPQYGMSPGVAQQRGVVASRLINYPGEMQQSTSYTGIKSTTNNQIENSERMELRSPQQLEREILRQRGLIEGRRTASQPQLPLDEEQNDPRLDRPSPSTPVASNKNMPVRRGSHGNLIETLTRIPSNGIDPEKDSDDGGFRSRLNAQGRSFDNKERPNPNSTQYNNSRSLDIASNLNKPELNSEINKNENIYSGMKQPIFNGMTPVNQRQIELSEDIGSSTNISKKINPGSTASSDYDKNGGPSSNVDSGRGSAAYSSGRRVGHDTSTESDPLPSSSNNRNNVLTSEPNGAGSKHYHDKSGHGGDSEWVDIVESELRQILEPKLHGLNINGTNTNQPGVGATGSETVSSVTPPLPPISPAASSPEATPRNSSRFKHQSLPYGSKPEYGNESRAVMPNQRAGWQHSSKHRNGGSKKHEHSSQYKKHMFGLETDITSTTTRSLDLSSMLDGQSDSDVSTQDARAIRRQLQGLENMYCEVLKLLGVRKPPNHNLSKYQPSDSRLTKRRYGSVSSLPSSSVSSRPVRDKRRSATEQRKKVNDIKGINKRFQRLESHVVTLARSVAHLSSEMRTQHLMIQEMENIRGEITALRNQQRSQSMPRMDSSFCTINGYGGVDASSLANPSRVKKLTKFFGDEPPLLRMFLKKLGYEKYATLLENERVGAAELPFLGEERLRALGVPLGPRLRILHEARLALPPSNTPHTTLCIV